MSVRAALCTAVCWKRVVRILRPSVRYSGYSHAAHVDMGSHRRLQWRSSSERLMRSSTCTRSSYSRQVCLFVCSLVCSLVCEHVFSFLSPSKLVCNCVLFLQMRREAEQEREQLHAELLVQVPSHPPTLHAVRCTLSVARCKLHAELPVSAPFRPPPRLRPRTHQLTIGRPASAGKRGRRQDHRLKSKVAEYEQEAKASRLQMDAVLPLPCTQEEYCQVPWLHCHPAAWCLCPARACCHAASRLESGARRK